MMAKDNFNCDMQNKEQRLALQSRLRQIAHTDSWTRSHSADFSEREIEKERKWSLWTWLMAYWKQAFCLSGNVALSRPQRSLLMGIESAFLSVQTTILSVSSVPLCLVRLPSVHHREILYSDWEQRSSNLLRMFLLCLNIPSQADRLHLRTTDSLFVQKHILKTTRQEVTYKKLPQPAPQSAGGQHSHCHGN